MLIELPNAKALAFLKADFMYPLSVLFEVAFCVVAAFVANTLESVIGAKFQDTIPWLSNDVVNVLNITTGALVAILLQLVFPA